ncbi:hypothetical protein J6590_056647 [Homalodisca vitripennis]|nr:hypothetical protein J6590_056647 [Homalodisca vitripennis]
MSTEWNRMWWLLAIMGSMARIRAVCALQTTISSRHKTHNLILLSRQHSFTWQKQALILQQTRAETEHLVEQDVVALGYHGSIARIRAVCALQTTISSRHKTHNLILLSRQHSFTWQKQALILQQTKLRLST